MSRIKQIIKYGWIHANELSDHSLKKKVLVFLDILKCYRKYRMWSNEYLREKFNQLEKEDRERIGNQYLKRGIKRDKWQKDFRSNRKFLIEYSKKKYELAKFRDKRNKAYAKRFNAGKKLMVEYDVNISRQHYLEGTIQIGDNVLLAKHVFIDYSGHIVIRNNVQITNGVIIETHHHPFHSDYREPRDKVESTKLLIDDGVVIGSRAIIMPTVGRIGKYARVGAGAVVTKDVPDYAVVAGVPAKIIRMQTI